MNRRKKKIVVWFGVLMTACAIAGCRNTKISVDREPGAEEQTKTEVEEEEQTTETASVEEEDSLQFQYIEKTVIEDYYGDKAECEVYAPRGSSYEDGFLHYYDHGLLFTANAYTSELSKNAMYEMWEELAKERVQQWEEDPEYSDIQIGETVIVGEDRYLVVSANRLDYEGNPYIVKHVFFMDMCEANKCLEWGLELSEPQLDEDAKQIVGEIAAYYGIDPDSLTVAGEWARLNEQRQVAAQDVYEPAEGSLVLEKAEGYQYMGKAVVPFDDGALQCAVMVPMGNQTDVGAWKVSSNMHGVSVWIECNKMYSQNFFAMLEENADSDCRIAEEMGCKDIEKGGPMIMKDLQTAAYSIVEYKEPNETSKDHDPVSKVHCMIRLKDNYLLSCNITLRSVDYDAATDALLRELESAYGIDLSDHYREKGAANDTETVVQDTLAALLKESGLINTGETPLPETILWFNATYAPLTYSNGWDWRLISGLEPSEDNITTTDMLLRTSWSVWDEKSALETVDSLKTKGHREKCKVCMEQLEDWGLLEVDSKDFVEKLSEKETDEDAGRYAIAYMMYQNDLDWEYITAWDLCRVNQLYAAYYLCGYMSYEEAMDASLENSLILQEMYGSWDEMMDAYMVGYQFWQGDLAISDESPAFKRYRYYEMLQEMPDGPYSLDWNMQLKKNW